jgi:hypothetical protein
MKIMTKFRKWFDNTLDPDAHQSDTEGLFRIFIAALAAIVIVFLATLLLGTQGESGQWGDFFGGFLNPILTFITFMGVLVTIVLQQRELKESREELRRSANALVAQTDISGRQLFESTFFQMLSLHNNIVNEIDLVIGSNTKHGRDCFNNFLKSLSKAYKSQEATRGEVPEIELIQNAYKEYWKTKNVELGHYYRYLFNMIRYVSENSYARPYHSKLIRAQLSDQEVVLLMYNSLSEAGSPFKQFALEFDLFDNLPIEMLLDPSHEKLVPRPEKPQ